ncbi:hypothetical protein Tco_0797928 [Tanacetum coccineum]
MLAIFIKPTTPMAEMAPSMAENVSREQHPPPPEEPPVVIEPSSYRITIFRKTLPSSANGRPSNMAQLLLAPHRGGIPTPLILQIVASTWIPSIMLCNIKDKFIELRSRWKLIGQNASRMFKNIESKSTFPKHELRQCCQGKYKTLPPKLFHLDVPELKDIVRAFT